MLELKYTTRCERCNRKIAKVRYIFILIENTPTIAYKCPLCVYYGYKSYAKYEEENKGEKNEK